MDFKERQKRASFISKLLERWRYKLREILNDKSLKASKEDEAIINLGISLDQEYKNSGYPQLYLKAKHPILRDGFESLSRRFIQNGKNLKPASTSKAIEKPIKTKYQKQLITDRACTSSDGFGLMC